jgi:parallel beta-helix repeat protein
MTHKADYTSADGSNEHLGRLIYADYVQYGLVSGCIFYGFSYSAIAISNTPGTTKAKSWVISDNVFRDGKAGNARGVFCRTVGEYITISNNIMNSIAFGVYLLDAANTLISDNVMTNGNYGVYIWQANAASINNGKTLITGNRINHQGNVGIYSNQMQANYDRGIVVTNNELLFNYNSGLHLKGAYSCVISGNRVSMSNTTDVGIKLEDYNTDVADYNVVTSNVITKGDLQNTMTGVNNVVEHNIVKAP